MMLSLLAALMPVPVIGQAAPPPPAILGTLPRQALPQRGCAAFLWTVEDQRLVAMAEPARLRIMLNGKATDLAATQADGAGAMGFAATTLYAGGGVSATLAMTIAPRESLQDGAVVSDASLRLVQTGGDEIAVPVGGLVGCAPQSP